MRPTIEILTRLQENSKNNHDEVFTKLFRYLLRPDIYYVAYQNLYANNGAATKGVDEDTADGFSEDKVNRIIEALRNGTYEPKPVRRTYIKKKNGKMRPLGLPTLQTSLCRMSFAWYCRRFMSPFSRTIPTAFVRAEAVIRHSPS